MVVEQGEVLNRIDENVESAKVDTHEGVEKLEEVDEERLNVIRNNHFVILKHILFFDLKYLTH